MPVEKRDAPQLSRVTFRIDAQTQSALEALEAEIGPKVRGRRSFLLRRLILEARARLSGAA